MEWISIPWVTLLTRIRRQLHSIKRVAKSPQTMDHGSLRGLCWFRVPRKANGWRTVLPTIVRKKYCVAFKCDNRDGTGWVHTAGNRHPPDTSNWEFRTP